MTRTTPVFLTLLIASPALSADWKPAEGPLKTRWAKDVDPARVLPEYPRPQLVRTDWMNLNGVWEFAPGRTATPLRSASPSPARSSCRSPSNRPSPA